MPIQLKQAGINLELNRYGDALSNFDSVITNVFPEALNESYDPEKSFRFPTIRINYLYAIAGKGDVYFKRNDSTKQNSEDLESALYWYDLYFKILVQIRKSYRSENSKLNLNKLYQQQYTN